MVMMTMMMKITTRPTRRKKLCLHDWYFEFVATSAGQLVQGEEYQWTHHEPLEERGLHEGADAVKERDDVDEDVEVVREPEPLEHVAPGPLRGEHVHDEDENGDVYPSQTCKAMSQIKFHYFAAEFFKCLLPNTTKE